MSKTIIYKQNIKTPLGDMIACASEDGVCFLDFVGRKNFDRLFTSMVNMINGEIIEIQNNENLKPYNIIIRLEKELDEYFSGKRKEFTVPLITTGTEFQNKVWNELLRIPYGKTISYKEEAEKINQKNAFRAVANANGKNKLSIIIPCHRVIASDGKLSGYGGGVDKKKFLISLEKNNI